MASRAWRQASLRRNEDYRRVFDEGRRLSGRWVVVYVLPSELGIRAGFVAGRGVGGAVVRNRARRLLKEAWRSIAPRAKPGFDLVFVARADIQRVRVHEVAREMADELEAAGVMG